MRFLVIGNALPETIVRSEDGYQRRHIGGVGAIMARELASEGADTAFLTTAPSGAPAEALLQALKLMDLKVAVIPGAPAQKNNSHATITTRLGGPIRAQGSWSIMGGLGKHIAILTPQFDWTLVSLTLRGNDLETVAKSARKLAVNATSKKHVALIPHIQEQAVTTMDQQESGKLMNLMSVREPSDLPSKLGAATLMVTRGAPGSPGPDRLPGQRREMGCPHRTRPPRGRFHRSRGRRHCRTGLQPSHGARHERDRGPVHHKASATERRRLPETLTHSRHPIQTPHAFQEQQENAVRSPARKIEL